MLLLCSLCADDGCFDVPLTFVCSAFDAGRDPVCEVCECSLGFVKSGGVVGISSGLEISPCYRGIK